MKGAFVFIILILVFGLVIFLASGGSLEKIGIQKVDFSILKKSTSTKTGNGESSSVSVKNKLASKPRETKISTPKPTSTPINPKDIPEGFTLNQLSPYFKKIKLTRVSPGSSRTPGRITLSTAFRVDESVNITGWVLQGKRSSLIIPQAVEVYDSTGLSQDRDIFLRRGQEVNIYTSESAIGRNFRINKCMGYLANSLKFTPTLPRNCPKPPRSEIQNFSGACYDYIRSLGTCAIPKGGVVLPAYDYACREYLDDLNYRGCFEKYRMDRDFLDNEWRIWTGSRFLDERHDRVLFFDAQGLLVSIYSY